MNIFSKWVAKNWGSVLARPQRSRRGFKRRPDSPGILRVEALEDRTLLSADYLVTSGSLSINGTSIIAHETNGGPSLVDQAQFGASVASIGDLNNDGVTDMAVGAFGGVTGAGAVHIMFMNANGTVASTTVINQSTPNGPIYGNSDSFGFSVAGLGDIDGDGVVDIAVGAITDVGNGALRRGAVHVLFLNTDGSVKNSVKIGDSTNGGPALRDGDHFGRSISVIGDLNGDGLTEIAVGANGDSTDATGAQTGFGRGAVHIFTLNTNGTATTFAKIDDSTPNGPALTNNDGFGVSTAALGDFDGDGVPDLAVGAIEFSRNQNGSVHILLLNSDGSIKSSTIIDESTQNGPVLASSDRIGLSIANLGDLDGDGVVDLAIGATSFEGTTGANGKLHVALMNSDGSVKSTSTIEGVVVPAANYIGPALDPPFNSFGTSVTSLGDLDGDGNITLAVGESYDTTGGVKTGAVYLFDVSVGNSPQNSLPANGPGVQFTGPSSRVNDSNVTLTWAESPTATSYELKVYHTGLGEEFVHQIFSGETAFRFAATLDPNVTYSAYVRATDGSGTGDWARLDFFQEPSLPPARPELTGPTANVFDNTVSITWADFATADDYMVLVYNVNQGKEIVRAQVGDVNSFTAPLASNDRYQVFVQAATTGGEHVLSDPLFFNVMQPLLPAPQVNIPELPGSNTTPQFTFAEVEGATDYEVLLYDKEAGRLHVPVAHTAGTPMFEVPVTSPLVPGRMYQLFVRGMSSEGTAGEYSKSEFAVPTDPQQDGIAAIDLEALTHDDSYESQLNVFNG